ncbi:hypothetical protein GCM10020000_11160 [Streptomyces olivoverticillatus]
MRLVGGEGFDLTEAGTRKRLAVYCVREPSEVPGIARLGPDPLAPGFTLEAFTGLLRGERRQIKGVLRDQSVISRHRQRLLRRDPPRRPHVPPFKLAATLTDAEAAGLYEALETTLREAVERSRGARGRGAEGGEEDRAARARPHRAALPGLRGHRARGLLQ